jgi:hypothetical protein
MTSDTTVYRDPVVLFRSEMNPDKPPSLRTPAAECEVTRAEVVVTPDRVTVHVWWAAVPARPG